ncbi:hypothetical protein [Porphyromonas levii]|uniref:hypothetical protein n=1 Tax=Porphyromonas levii TaxID=28114 RepID=UPI001B8BB2B0|nr:hypothetical protein [Porphyromonas levii]MBR8770542.1 hypothetical protein [Porphyromonas levii]
MNSKNIHTYGSLLLLFLAILMVHGCKPREVESGDGMFRMAVNLRSINTNDEDRVASLRMIIAESATGKVVYNDKPKFPNGYEKRSEVIEVKNAGLYDFYFFANEDDSGITPEQKTKIQTLRNVAQLYPQEKIPFDPDFVPNKVDKLFPMLAVYKNVSVSGGSIDDPQVIPVTLIRNFSKVTININRKIEVPGAKHAVIKRIYLKNLATQFIPLFTMRTHAEEGLGITTTTKKLSKPLPVAPYNTAGEIFTETMYISELLRQGTDPQGTTVVIEYTQTAESTVVKTLELPIDIQYIDELETIFAHLGLMMKPEDITKFTTQSILRNMHYIVNINISDAQTQPVVRLEVEPWTLIANDFTSTDDYMNASKEDVVMNYLNGDPNSFMILSNFEGRILSYSVQYADPLDTDWFTMTPANPTYITGNLEFRTSTTSENIGGTPRIATVTFHVDGYAHDVRVRVVQLPRQDMVARKYVNFIGTGGSVNIRVNSYGYDWRAEIVENYSTISGTHDWIRLMKNSSQLTIKAEPTNDVNLLRYAVIKIYDGSDRAAYIWVEQGNYKEVTVNGYTILDRNLGALKTATDRNAWPVGAPISHQERVRVNGFYYQWGRVPDGYHWHGINVLDGTINTSLTSEQLNAYPVDYTTHPDGMPLKWWDPAVPGSQDPQYGRFIAAEPWLSTSGSFPQLWGYPKKVGVDPCPEGYRVPTLAEMNGILSKLEYIESSQGFWAESSDGTTYVYFPRSQFRSSNGTLNDWLEPKTHPTYYSTSELYNNLNSKVSYLYTHNTQAREYNYPVSYGIPVRCIKE